MCCKYTTEIVNPTLFVRFLTTCLLKAPWLYFFHYPQPFSHIVYVYVFRPECIKFCYSFPFRSVGKITWYFILAKRVKRGDLSSGRSPRSSSQSGRGCGQDRRRNSWRARDTQPSLRRGGGINTHIHVVHLISMSYVSYDMELR